MRETDCLLARLGVEPDDVDIYFDLADAYDREGDLAKAKSTITRLLQKSLSLEDWGDGKRWLGWIYYKENDFDTAIEIAEELLAAELDAYQAGQAHHLIGRCLLGKRRFAKQVTLSEQYLTGALQHLERAAELVKTEGKDRAEILMVWGTAFRLKDQSDIAIEVLNSALEMAPAESSIAGMCHEQLGLTYLEDLQEYERAISHLEMAVGKLRAADSSYPLVWVYAALSQAFVRSQQYEKAVINAKISLETAECAEDREDQLAEAHQVCGDAYYHSELDLSLAQKHYRKYLKLLSQEELTGRAQTLLKLADIERMKGKHKRALKGFKEVLSLNAPGIDYGALYLVMGECYAKSKNFEEAVEEYQAAIEHSGDDQDALANAFLYLGHSLFELKRYGEAADAYREGIKYVDPKAPERSELMKYLMAANEFKSR